MADACAMKRGMPRDDALELERGASRGRWHALGWWWWLLSNSNNASVAAMVAAAATVGWRAMDCEEGERLLHALRTGIVSDLDRGELSVAGWRPRVLS